MIELEWVKEGKNGILEPLESAPQDFKDGLINYNEEVQKNTQEIWELKQQYKAAGGFGIAAYFIFKGDLDKETVIQRLQARALKDKDGPSAKVLQSMQTQGNSEPASSNQESDDYLNLNALKTGQHRKLDPNNPTPTSTFQSFLASLNVTNYEQRTTFLCSQIKDANALLKQLNYEELQGLFKHPLWPQMADKMLNDPDENNSAVYVQAIQKAQDYVAMVDRKLVSAIGEEFNSHLFSDSSKWSAAVANLQESIQSYNGKLLYQFKSDERKSQIKALETLCKELESLSSSALPTKISALSKIIVELSHLSKTIQEGQPGKKSTLASKIDSVKAKVIELFDLSKSPIGLSSQDPMKSLLAYEETRLGDLKVHQSLSHLDSQWWSDEGMAVIKQLPKSCYNYDTVQLLNTTKPSQFDASVVKAIKTDERFISADFAALQKRGRFIQAIEEKNKLIGNSMKQAIALLKDPGNVSQAQAILKAAKATIEELFQDKQEKQWSWFRFKYIVPESGKILNEVIAKLEPYVEQKIAEDPSHSR